MGVIDFNKANCKNCYKCIRFCPVKAIKIVNHQAQIVEDLCIGCGNCFRNCPQNAKQVSSDVSRIKEWLSKEQVVVSLAPSFPGGFDVAEPLRVVGALKALGFAAVEETAIGAEAVSLKYREDYDSAMRHVITTSCPTVNILIEKYYPALVPYLSSVVSPMMAHGALLKKRYPGARVVFAGPCISKKIEVLEQADGVRVDAVMTFDELAAWISESGMDLQQTAPADFDNADCDVARFYPLAGGVAKSSFSGEAQDPFAESEGPGDGKRRIIKIDGLTSCKDFLDNIDQLKENYWIEMNACPEGCINGPGNVACPLVKYERMERVKGYIAGNRRQELEAGGVAKAPAKRYRADAKELLKSVPEDAIEEILHKTGKYKRSDELNCGTCGYDSCREKAAAVYCGLAEIEMCLPYMRNRNEAVSNLIIASTPNAIAVLDRDYRIMDFNGAAEQIFEVSRAEVLGKDFTQIFDYNPFGKLRVSEGETSYSGRGYYIQGDIHFMEILTYLPEQNLYLGIFVDISQEIKKEQAYQAMQVESLDMAQKVIDKQMRVAHEIAGLLGETTAETKVTLTKLKTLITKEAGDE
jgi:PAS domain S-box-containing protein